MFAVPSGRMATFASRSFSKVMTFAMVPSPPAAITSPDARANTLARFLSFGECGVAEISAASSNSTSSSVVGLPVPAVAL